MSILNYQDLKNERNMLDGNLNRLMVTENMEELERMVRFAKIRIDNIVEYRKKKIKEIDLVRK